MTPHLPVVPASFSTASGTVGIPVDASHLVSDVFFDVDRMARLAKANFQGMEVGHVLMDHFVARMADPEALKVVQASVQEGGGLRGRILSGDFMRLVARQRPDVYAEFSRTYRDDPALSAWCSREEPEEVSAPRFS